jgi:trk system potassium uptake protein TrkH
VSTFLRRRRPAQAVPAAYRPPSLWRRLQPVQLLVGSFALLILFGTVGLLVLPGLYTGPRLGWLDALFTSTSAVCVTGLIVVDTATYFTPFGQAFILLLIQLGGLGIVTFTTVAILTFGRRLSLRAEELSASGVEVAPIVDYRRLARNVVRYTLALEGIGALLLYMLWIPRFGAMGAIWPATFHAISAFCNAGFSTFTDSLVSMADAPFTLLVIATLIVAGGVGFLTLEEITQLRKERRAGRVARMSLHSRLVLVTTAALIVLGWAVFAIFEWRLTLGELGPLDRTVNALFMSITARTAGFNTIDYSRAAEGTSFLTILLMFVGGSPGSTAGGIKTTTAALIGLVALSRLRGAAVTSVAGRSIREDTIQRAVGLFAISFGVLTAAIFLFTAAEIGTVQHAEAGGAFLGYMFEATSAFNTVGLSLGVTDTLSPLGQFATILLMYIGRVGALAFVAAITLPRTSARGFRYAYEDVIVG